MINSTISLYNNTDNCSILNEIIHLNHTLSSIDMPIEQKGYLAKRQLHLINVYTKQIRDRITDQTNENFRWQYRPSTMVRMNDTKSSIDDDKYKSERYFHRKRKDFRINLNIYYIEMYHKIHKYYDHIRSFIIKKRNILFRAKRIRGGII